MPFAASLSTDKSLDDAVASVCDDLRRQLVGAAPDLTFAFVSAEHRSECETLAAELQRRLGCRVLLGCTGEMIAGGSREIESGPALSVWSALLPGAELETFHVTFERTPDGIVSAGLPEPRENDADVRAILFLGEPFSCAPDSVIERFADDFPGVPLIGGMASGSRRPGGNKLFLDGECLEQGGVGVVIRGGPRVRAIVSQGCRPIGGPYIVTKADENVILGLGGEVPLKRFAEVYQTLSPADQELARNGLHVGLAMDEYRATFGRGDFLISNVVGIDAEEGVIAIGNYIRAGQTVQYHIRDAATAHEDLVELLKKDLAGHKAKPQGALLFSCNGRGTRLFETPNHDARTVRELAGPVPLAGFFAQGEFGPVGSQNYIHGFTASVALFEET